MTSVIKTTRTMKEQIKIAKAEGLKVVAVRSGGRHVKLVTRTPDGREAVFSLMARSADPRMVENFRREIRKMLNPTEL